MRLTLYVVEDRSPRRRKPRHRLKESIGKARDMPTKPVGQAAKESKGYPADRNGDIAIATRELALAPLTDDTAP